MNLEKREKLRKRIKTANTILKFTILIILLVGIPIYLFFFQKDLISTFSDLEKVETYLGDNYLVSTLIYIGCQIGQIVICIIPGQWLQIGAGYIYGFFLATVLSIIGAVLGTILTYHIARFLGHDAMLLLFGKEKVNHYLEKLNSKGAALLIFLIFLIPGVPKDLCNYIAGVSEIKLKLFLIISIIGRTPAMMISILIGEQLKTESYISAIIVACIGILLGVFGILYRKKIHSKFDEVYEKLKSN